MTTVVDDSAPTARDRRVTVLGLGRMGAAMARRLAGEGWDVLGWHRSGQPVAEVTVATELDRAVASADIVLLSLFDDASCAEILTRARPALPASATVVNTTTTSPQAAQRFAADFGARYVHAPVLGSVPAVTAGSLQILTGGEAATLDSVTPLLAALGNAVHMGQPETAAAVKLIANGTLAGALITVGDALRQAEALGLERSLVLEVLERGVVGGLVRTKRDRLTDPTGNRAADFSVAGLAKDAALLATASRQPWPHAKAIEVAVESGAVHADDDIAALATAAPAEDGVRAPLEAYIRGHATGDPRHFLDAFLPSAHIEGLREGSFVSWTLEEYRKLFPGHPAPDEASRRRRIDEIVVTGSIATATMTLYHGADTFTDMFLLVRTDAGWRIANKIYHRH